MKAVHITRFLESLDGVVASDIDPPVLKDGQVLVRVMAAGVNFVDTLYARGLHQNNRRHVQPPFTLGLEFAGVVDDISPGAETPFRRGDRVYGSSLGAYAEQIAVPASVLCQIPPGWSFAAAAGMAATAPVSYGALVTRGNIQAGETVLVLGAAGGLGCMAVQIAAAARCRVIAVTSTAEKCAVARRCGADVCIDTSVIEKSSWCERVREATPDGRGVDVVFDPVGAVGDSLKCLAHRGRILVVGFAARDNATLEQVAMNRVLLKQATIIGYRYGESLRRDPAENAQIWHKLEALISSKKIQPVVYDTPYHGLESVANALKDIADRRVWGKGVVRVSDDEHHDIVKPNNAKL
ncbi:alcohol dehydrogenase [Ophiostoma piceae UAMH 11346]|uniref:Alcohol dehydrogenase n=1 Tax=Ophiostoma piceae (strain UAMH 11346) TaxID=1262450 RepID=S3BZD1_OPHP1|nr:alcohol dehydrogenase [Ophiostoma piceae UAMH 11346]